MELVPPLSDLPEPSLDAAQRASWLRRIGCAGDPAPTLATLRALARAQVEAVPFENLDVLLGRPIRIDPEGVVEKVCGQGRGGYCFELNALMLWGLRGLGFDARPLSARVRLQRARAFTPPRTHMFVRVELDGASWLVDAGVGGLSPTAPLRLVEGETQETPHEPRRLIREDGRWFHQAHLPGAGWQDVCEFTLEEMPPIDRIVGHWYTSAHPASHFRNRLLVARADPAVPGGRLTLLNRALTRRGPDGAAATEILDTPEALLAALARTFGLRFTPGTTFDLAALDFPPRP